MNEDQHKVNHTVLQNYKGDEQSFSNITEFCEAVFNHKNDGNTYLAHNMKGYDGVFIYNWLINIGHKPYITYAGSKIMSMELKNPSIRIIDSYNFIQSPLSKFPKQFGLT
eukprot:Lithocolla_globosa_v1_NODE_144_length_5725_cov_14.152028.p5 type:complete len:110 gc:universal NODE_144_length_5725_cov_14.152028:3137-3466(+)